MPPSWWQAPLLKIVLFVDGATNVSWRKTSLWLSDSTSKYWVPNWVIGTLWFPKPRKQAAVARTTAVRWSRPRFVGEHDDAPAPVSKMISSYRSLYCVGHFSHVQNSELFLFQFLLLLRFCFCRWLLSTIYTVFPPGPKTAWDVTFGVVTYRLPSPLLRWLAPFWTFFAFWNNGQSLL